MQSTSALAAAAAAHGLPSSAAWSETGAPIGAWHFYASDPRPQYGVRAAVNGDQWVTIAHGNGWNGFLKAGTLDQVALGIMTLSTTAAATPGSPGPDVTVPTLTTGMDGSMTFTGWFVSPPETVPSKLVIVAPLQGEATITWTDWSGGDPALAEAVDMIGMGDVGMRKSAVAKIAGMAGAEATKALVDVLRDSNPGVRAAAADALAGRGDASAVSGLIDRFRGETDAAARLAEVRALVAIGGDESRSLLQQVASTDPDPAVRAAASGPH